MIFSWERSRLKAEPWKKSRSYRGGAGVELEDREQQREQQVQKPSDEGEHQEPGSVACAEQLKP